MLKVLTLPDVEEVLGADELEEEEDDDEDELDEDDEDDEEDDEEEELEDLVSTVGAHSLIGIWSCMAPSRDWMASSSDSIKWIE